MSSSRVSIYALSAACAAAFSMAGCAGNYGSALDGRYQFAVDVPAAVSSAWREGDSVWIVPTRNTFIDAAQEDGGKPVKIEANGASLRIVSQSSKITFRVNGGERQTVVVPRS